MACRRACLGLACLATAAATCDLCPAGAANSTATATSLCRDSEGRLIGNVIDPSCAFCAVQGAANNRNTAALCAAASGSWAELSCSALAALVGASPPQAEQTVCSNYQEALSFVRPGNPCCAAASRIPQDAAVADLSGLAVRVGLYQTDWPPWWLWADGEGEPRGLLSELMAQLSTQLGGLNITWVPVNAAAWSLGQATLLEIDEANIRAGWYDMAPAVILATSAVHPAVGMTPPFFYDKAAVIVPKAFDSEGSDLLRVFLPFYGTLWAAIVAYVFAAAVGMSVLQQLNAAADRADDVPRRSRPRLLLDALSGYGGTLYAAFALLLQGDQYECARSDRPPARPTAPRPPDLVAPDARADPRAHRWTSVWQRGLRLSVLIFALVITATYTANLAAAFSRPTFTISGPLSREALRTAVVCCPNPSACVRAAGLGYIADAFVPAPTLAPACATDPTSSACQLPFNQLQWCREAVHAGRASAIFTGTLPLAHSFLYTGDLGGCDDFTLAPGLEASARLTAGPDAGPDACPSTPPAPDSHACAMPAPSQRATLPPLYLR